MPAPATVLAGRRELDSEPAPGFPTTAGRRGGEPEARVEVTGHQRGGPEYPIGWPGMPVEHPDGSDAESAHRMKAHFPREPARKPHVMVARHDVDREAAREQSRKELEQLSPHWGGHTNDRLLEVPCEEERLGTRGVGDSEELLRHLLRSGSGRTRLTGSVTSQTQVSVGGDEQAAARGASGGNMEDGVTGHWTGDRQFHTQCDGRVRHERSRSVRVTRAGRVPAGSGLSVYIQPVADSL